MSISYSPSLEFHKVKEQLTAYAMSPLGRAHIDRLAPQSDPAVIRLLLDEVCEAFAVIEHGASIPLPALDGIEAVMANQDKGYLLTAADLTLLAKLLDDTRRLKRFMLGRESVAPRIASYARSLHEVKELEEELARCIRHGRVDDHASAELGRIRKKQGVVADRLRKKLEGALSRYRPYLQEQVLSMRAGRHVIPVKKEYRKLVPGSVLDESASGQTVFLEPAEAAALHTEEKLLQIEEAREEDRILGELTALVDRYRHELSINLEAIGHYDFLFAKARYALAIGGRNVELNTEGSIDIRSGRHPLLDRTMVPLDIAIGDRYRALLITGPNTGGKTVCLKTVGLLTIMVQAGLLPPVGEGSRFAVYTGILADIGDGQSLEQSLSTFSSHIKSMIGILAEAGPATLVLLDELAAGTDPGEGIGLSIALLEALYGKGATLLATTHFGEIKRFAEETPGFINARMEFDTETLQPRYRLTVGQAGSSYAFHIAAKLGMPPAVIERSRALAAAMARREPEPGPEPSGSGGGEPLAAPERNPQPGIGEGETARRPRSRENGSSGKPEGRSGTAGGSGADLLDANRPETELPGSPGRRTALQIGDCVWISSLKRTGIVKTLPDERGNVLVVVQKQAVKVNRKRLSLHIGREELYPDDYDMDIVFEDKETRKKRKLMSRKYAGDVTIVRRPDE
ncbi:hypothetical protein J31TS4_41580 [Paenibacillus sp. J31TS4]|uniref:endonuclease MutS2 n=1 Tax=Paenibacillus sp. J31TS4 TaxID=2807195 RepID=UPI001B04D0B1|nr:DNA mismatch repair protein MutS [Paenibacillus sp. J31TS4]GIP40878.1 hypothetical protein J31TS4_41580 [Paenibacillus sp. J31TS4]